MKLSVFAPTQDRTTGHWVLTGLALGLLSAYFGFLWWFGPEKVDVAFGVWALATIPLLVAAYSRTRVRTLIAAAFMLSLFAFVAAKAHAFYYELGSLPRILAAVAFLIAFPVLITLAWLWCLHSRHGMAASSRRFAVALVLVAFGTTLIGGWRWAERELVERPEAPAAAMNYAGCYEIRLGRWLPSDMRGHGVGGIVPERLHLDTTRGTSGPDSLRYYRSREIGQRLIRPGWWGAAYWVPLQDGHVQLVWSTGLHGVMMDLRPRGNTLRGRAVGFTDVGGLLPDPRARVSAVRVPCGSVALDSTRRAL